MPFLILFLLAFVAYAQAVPPLPPPPLPPAPLPVAAPAVVPVALPEPIVAPIAIEEKSIFSTENEIDFHKLLSKDTTAEGYALRMRIVEARSVQVDGEFKHIMENFPNTYPALEPQKPDETPESFAERHASWNDEGIRQVTELHKKYDAYKQKLAHSHEVLNGYIISAQSTIVREAVTFAEPQKAKESYGGLNLRSWTRIITFAAAAICGGLAVHKHSEVQARLDDANTLAAHPYENNSWRTAYLDSVDAVRKEEMHRNIYGAASAFAATAGIVTFFF